MYTYAEIKQVHLELSSICNARCPGCPRNFYGYPNNDGFVERNMTLPEIKKIFSKGVLAQIQRIRINGNFGDFVSNNESPEIIKWILTQNNKISIDVSTNGSAQNPTFWKKLGKLGIIIEFCIDGLEDTHDIYRQGTNFNKILDNARVFIESGGTAYCKMISFEHNKHQVDILRKTTLAMGFSKFKTIKNTRGALPAYDSKGKLINIIDNFVGKTTLIDNLHKRQTDEVLLEDIVDARTPHPIKCEVSATKEVYISSVGDVFPCCFLGFEPKTYGHGNYFEPVNKQITALVKHNNAIKYPLDQCIKWFNEVEKTWDINSFEEGRLVACNDNCGTCNV